MPIKLFFINHNIIRNIRLYVCSLHMCMTGLLTPNG